MLYATRTGTCFLAAACFTVFRTWRIVAVDGLPTPDLDDFLAVTAGKEDGESVRLRIETLEGKVRVVTLETDLHYWPTQELRRTGEGWVRRRL